MLCWNTCQSLARFTPAFCAKTSDLAVHIIEAYCHLTIRVFRVKLFGYFID